MIRKISQDGFWVRNKIILIEVWSEMRSSNRLLLVLAQGETVFNCISEAEIVKDSQKSILA